MPSSETPIDGGSGDLRVESQGFEVGGSYVRLDEPTLADAARRLKRVEAVRDRFSGFSGMRNG